MIMRNFDPAVDAFSMTDLPPLRVSNPTECAACEGRMPTGYWAARIDTGEVICSASCAFRVLMDLGEPIEAMRNEMYALDSRACELRSEAWDLEAKLDALQARVYHAIRRRVFRGLSGEGKLMLEGVMS